MPLNLTQLATLREFVRRGTLTAAAQALGYTPGAASQQITALEREVGMPLLRKAGRQLVLTDAGRVLAHHAEELLLAESRALRAVAAAEGSVGGSLVIGTWGSTTAALLGPVLKEVAARHPGLAVHSREIDVDEAARAVRRGDVDLAFGLDYPDAPMPRDDRIRLVQLHHERFGIAVARDHAYAGRTRLGLADLATSGWVLPSADSAYGQAVRAVCRRHGFEPHVTLEVTDTAATLVLVADGLGVAPVTDLMVRLNPRAAIARVALRESMTRHVVLVLPEQSAGGAALDAVAAVIHDTVAS